MEKFTIPENPEYIEEIRKIKTEDKVHADFVNGIIQALINNDAFIKKIAEEHIKDKNNPHETKFGNLPDKPAIPEAVRVKGSAEADYHTGDVNITPENIGLENVGNFKAVSTMASQELSETEKSNARLNIDAAPSSHASAETTYGASTSTNYGHAMASSTMPKANGTAAVGTETAKFARGDHVHPLQTSVTGSSGSCTGNAASATKATQDGNGNNIANTYLTKTGKAASATTADYATKATQDGNGNNIVNTYATKAGNAWKAIKTVNYNGSNAIVNKNLYKEVRIMAYVANGSETTVYGTYDIQIDELDNFANEILYFGDTSKNDTCFYITLVGNSAIVENDYRGMTIKVFAK